MEQREGYSLQLGGTWTLTCILEVACSSTMLLTLFMLSSRNTWTPMKRWKQNLELMARDSGVIPQSYLSGNGGSFTSANFPEHLGTLKQAVKFAGVEAYHHNGHAERAIQTIMSIACTMMLHSAVHWTDVANATLRPMAVTHAIFLHNHVPNLVSAQVMYSQSHGGNRGSTMNCMFGDAQCMLWRKQLLSARSYHAGNHGLFAT